MPNWLKVIIAIVIIIVIGLIADATSNKCDLEDDCCGITGTTTETRGWLWWREEVTVSIICCGDAHVRTSFGFYTRTQTGCCVHTEWHTFREPGTEEIPIPFCYTERVD